MGQSEEEKKAYRKVYYMRPEIRAKRIAYGKSYYQRPDVQARLQSPALKAKEKQRKHSPKYQAQKLIWDKNYRENPKHKDYRLLRAGLSVKEKKTILEKQFGLCAICGTSKFNAFGPHLDHDHKTGMVRGVLCQNCNLAFGFAKEDVVILHKMIRYLS